jgi:hypothetical protein
MNLIKTFRIIVGVLLLINTVTIFALLFLEIESLAIMFDFSFDYSAENLGEAIAGAIAGMMAGLMFFFGMILVGIINAAIYITFGVLTLSLKRAKAMPIIVTIFTGLALYIGIRAFMILTLGGYPSIILPLRLASDIIVIGLSITNFFLIIRAEKIPRVESS